MALGSYDEARPAYLLAEREKTPICKDVPMLDGVVPTLDGTALIVTSRDDTFLADLACTRKRTLTATSRAFPLESPSQKAWIAYYLDDKGDGELRVLGASGDRTVSPADNSSWIAWLDDERFLFVNGGVAYGASVSADAQPSPVMPPEDGCRDMFLKGAPRGGVAAFARSCGEGTAQMIVVQPKAP